MSVPLGAGEQIVWSSNKNTDSVNFSQQKFYNVTVSDNYFSKETLYSAANVLLTNRRLIVSSVSSPGVHMAFELGQITGKWLTGSKEFFNFSVNTIHGLKKYQISTPITMMSKTEAQKLNDFWQNAFAVSGSAPLPVTVVSSEAPPVQDSELQNLEKKKVLLRKKLRYKGKLKQARKYERQLDYEQALNLYRELDRVEDIRRVNKEKMGGAGPGAGATTIVHGNYIDDRDKYTTNIDDRDTIIKDSVVSRANVGAGAGVRERISQLKELHDDGLISDEVFESKKQKLLKP
jgi:hypothetical protein